MMFIYELYFKNDFFFWGGGDKIYLSIAPRI